MTALNKWILGLILLFATVLRLYQIDTLPISLFGDETDVGYHAWSLFTTGKDYMGHTLPLYIQSLTEWRAPLLMYVTAPFVGFLGMSAFSVRLPVAILGVIGVYLVFLVSTKITNNKKIGLFAAGVLAITPWHIHYSRAAFEVALLLDLLLLGTYLFISRKIFLSLIPFVLTFYTYSTSNIFTPLLVVSLYLVYRPTINIKKDFLRILPAFFLALPIAYFILLGPASGRFTGISIFSDSKAVESLVTTRTQPWVLGSPLEKYFHNKPVLYITTFVRNYTESLSGDFLFLQGDPNFRHSVGGFGELPLFVAPFIVLGLAVLLSNIKEKSHQLILSWLLTAPIASSLTQGGGSHATRLFVMLPPLVIIAGIGFAKVFEVLKESWARAVFFGIIIFFAAVFVVNYWHRYSSHYRYESQTIWQYGYEKVFQDLSNADPGGKVYINNTQEPSLLKFLFYTKYSPVDFQKHFVSDVTITDLLPGFSGYSLADKYYFGELNSGFPMSDLLLSGDFYLASQLKEIPGNWDWSKDTPDGFEVISITRNAYGDPLFTLVRKL